MAQVHQEREAQLTARLAASPNEDAPKQTSRLATLNSHLASRTTILGSKPSVADIALLTHLAPLISSWDAPTRTGEQGYHHIVRHADFVQHSPLFGPLQLDAADRVEINADDVVSPIKPVDAKAEKERKKREKEEAAKAGAASAAAAGATPSSAAPDAATPQEDRSVKEKVKDKAAHIGEAAAAAVGAGGKSKKDKKEKKEKQPKAPQPKPIEKPLGPNLVDMRVGHILKAVQHPNADSLYVSTIACGDAPGTENTEEYEGQVCRTVCSGLNGKVPLDVMNGAKIVVIANLKPVTMRGIKSCAMVFCASTRAKEGEDPHGGTVELLKVPEGANVGDKVYVEGFDGEPEAQLNPKKKVFETVQPGFYTTDNLEVVWDIEKTSLTGEGEAKKTGSGKVITKAGTITARTIVNASCS